MARTPDTSGSRSHLFTQLDGVDGILPRALHRRHVESERVFALEGTANMELSIATRELTRYAGSLVRLADPADFSISVGRDQSKALCRFQFLRVAEFDLRIPDGAHHMDPVISCGSLQRFSGSNWLPDCLLPLSIELDRFSDHLLLQSLLFSLSVRLFLVRRLGRFHQLMFGPCNWAEDTFI